MFTVRRGCDECLACRGRTFRYVPGRQYRERGIRVLDSYQTGYIVDQEEYVVYVAAELEAVGVLLERSMEASSLITGYSFWAFSDIFSENYLPSVPVQGGCGLLNIHGIAKPLYRAFELLHHLGTELLDVEGSRETVNVWIVRKQNTVTILRTSHAMPRHPIQAELLNLRLTDAPQPHVVSIERIDEDHANPRRLWKAMGEPLYLNTLQVDQLKAASCLMKQPQPWTYAQQSIDVSLALPPHAVAAITVEFA